MKRRKRRYPECDYGHKERRWPRERPVWKVALAVEPTDDGTVRLAFHVPHPILVRTVFNQLQGMLFADYQMTEEIMTQILNGKCFSAWVVTVSKPDLHRLSLNEWPTMIKSMMERRFRCEVTYFDNYEKFLNA